MKKLLVLLVSVLIFAGCSNDNSTVTPSTEKPEFVTIGTQVWKTKNLDVDHYRNGDLIPQVTDTTQWGNLTTGAWCYFKNELSNGVLFGRLYNWYAVNDSRGLAPTGWHIPSHIEWKTLTEFSGGGYGNTLAGDELKRGSFSALLGGYRDFNGKYIAGVISNNGAWWTATENDVITSWYRTVSSESNGIGEGTNSKNYGLSVRCLKD